MVKPKLKLVEEAKYFGLNVVVAERMEELSIVKLADKSTMDHPQRDDSRVFIVETKDLVL